MKKGARALLCLAAIGWAGMATASPLPPLVGPYTGNYNVESINTGSNLHTFWLPNLISGASNYWQFDASGGSFNHTGANATLNGTIVNNTDAMKRFDVDITFNYSHKGEPGAGPKCEFGGACSSTQFMNQSAQFEYFTYAAATLTGLNMLSGLTLALSVAPIDGSLPPQLGYGANNKDIDEFGFSSWFIWNVTSNTTGSMFQQSGQGDINIELTPVPIPAALPLLASVFAGFGFFGWLRRRRSEASA